MAGNDWRLGGFTMEELLGAPPVTKTKKQLKTEKKQVRKDAGKRGIVSGTLTAPFRMVIGLVKLPVLLVTKLVNGIGGALTEVIKLPVRIVGALVSPFRKN